MHTPTVIFTVFAIFASLAACAVAGDGGASKPSSSSLISKLPLVSSLSNDTVITDHYSDEEAREWYESEYESIGSAEELREAILICKDFYAIYPLWKSSYVVLDSILGSIADAKYGKPSLAVLPPMLVQVAVDCVSVDKEYGGELKYTKEYNFYQSLIEETPISNWALVLGIYKNTFVDIFFSGKQYTPKNGDSTTQAIQIAFQNLFESVSYANDRDMEGGDPKGTGKIIEDMTPVQILLLGRLLAAFADIDIEKMLSFSKTQKWKKELNRLGQFMMVIVVGFCALLPYVCMGNIRALHKQKNAGNGEKKRMRDGKRRNQYQKLPKIGKKHGCYF